MINKIQVVSELGEKKRPFGVREGGEGGDRCFLSLEALILALHQAATHIAEYKKSRAFMIALGCRGYIG